MTMQERWDAVADRWKTEPDIKKCVHRFFEILDTKETTDEGREFKPVFISSCRVFSTFELDHILKRMKELL